MRIYAVTLEEDLNFSGNYEVGRNPWRLNIYVRRLGTFGPKFTFCLMQSLLLAASGSKLVSEKCRVPIILVPKKNQSLL